MSFTTDLHWPATQPSTWTARWIAPAGAKENNASYFRARKSFTVATVPQQALLHIAAESIYLLFINGVAVGRGPVRGALNINFFDTWDITRHLKPGKNWVAVKVNTPGKYPSFKYSPAQPGVFIQCDGISLATDATWESQVAAEHRPDAPQYTFQIGPMEWKDLRQEPIGWQTGSDAGKWEAPDVLHENEQIGGKALKPRDIPGLQENRYPVRDIPLLALTPPLKDVNDTAVAELMTNEPHRPLSSPLNITPLLEANGEPVVIQPPADGSGVAIIFDFWRELNGAFELDIEAPAGTVVDIGQEEEMRNGRLHLTLFSYRFADRYILRDGRQIVGNELAERGFRMIQIVIRNFDKPVKIHRATAIDRVYPYVSRGSFASSNDTLNQLWNVCGETIRACTTDTIVDCPWRENACYLNDMIVEVTTSLQLFGDPRVLARGLRLAARQRRSHDALFPAVVPFGHVTGMTPQQAADHLVLTAGNLTIPIILEEFLNYTGDRDLCAEIGQHMPSMLDTFASWEEADGIARTPAHIWNFIDWSYPVDMQGEQTSALEWLRVMALDATARVLQRVDPKRDVSNLTRKAEQLATAIDKRFWDARAGHYLEGVRAPNQHTELEADRTKEVKLELNEQNSHELVTELAQAYAILSGRLPADRQQALAHKLINQELHAPDLFMHHFVLRALVATGHTKAALKRVQKYWGPIVTSGSPTIWEMSAGKSAFSGAGSLCHGFATTPVDFMQSVILGITPTADGFTRCRFTPRSAGLTHAQGRVPTPHGNLHVAWKREGNVLNAELMVPNGVTVEITGGKTLAAGRHTVSVADVA